MGARGLILDDDIGVVAPAPSPSTKPQPETQYDRMCKLVTALNQRMSVTDADVMRDQLGTLLAEAQNAPPLGGADGTLPVNKWEALRDLEAALTRYTYALAHASAVTRRIA